MRWRSRVCWRSVLAMFAPAKLRPRITSLPFSDSVASASCFCCCSCFDRSRSVMFVSPMKCARREPCWPRVPSRGPHRLRSQQPFQTLLARWRAPCSVGLGGEDRSRGCACRVERNTAMVATALVDHRRRIFVCLPQRHGGRRVGEAVRRLAARGAVGALAHDPVAAILHRERGWTWTYWLLVPVSLLSLYSRIYLGVHWPIDVLAGAIVGVVWFAMTSLAFRDESGKERTEKG